MPTSSGSGHSFIKLLCCAVRGWMLGNCGFLVQNHLSEECGTKILTIDNLTIVLHWQSRSSKKTTVIVMTSTKFFFFFQHYLTGFKTSLDKLVKKSCIWTNRNSHLPNQGQRIVIISCSVDWTSETDGQSKNEQSNLCHSQRHWRSS